MSVPPMVRVEWLDSWSEHGWRPVSEGAELGPDHCVSVGFLINDAPDRLVLAHSVSTEIQNAAGWLTIPKVAITKQTMLRAPK